MTTKPTPAPSTIPNTSFEPPETPVHHAPAPIHTTSKILHQLDAKMAIMREHVRYLKHHRPPPNNASFESHVPPVHHVPVLIQTTSKILCQLDAEMAIMREQVCHLQHHRPLSNPPSSCLRSHLPSSQPPCPCHNLDLLPPSPPPALCSICDKQPLSSLDPLPLPILIRINCLLVPALFLSTAQKILRPPVVLPLLMPAFLSRLVAVTIPAPACVLIRPAPSPAHAPTLTL